MNDNWCSDDDFSRMVYTHTSYEHVKRDDFARKGADDKYTARAVPRVVATAIRHLHARAGISLLGDEKRWERFTVRSLAPVKYVYVARRNVASRARGRRRAGRSMVDGHPWLRACGGEDSGAMETRAVGRGDGEDAIEGGAIGVGCFYARVRARGASRGTSRGRAREDRSMTRAASGRT